MPSFCLQWLATAGIREGLTVLGMPPVCTHEGEAGFFRFGYKQRHLPNFDPWVTPGFPLVTQSFPLGDPRIRWVTQGSQPFPPPLWLFWRLTASSYLSKIFHEQVSSTSRRGVSAQVNQAILPYLRWQSNIKK